MEKFTHFQTWVLFMTYDKNDDEWVSSRTLLRECCKSSFEELDPNDTDNELEELHEEGYLELEPQTNQLLATFPHRPQPKYRISNIGIAYVRKTNNTLQNVRIGPRVDKFLNSIDTRFPKFVEGVRNKILDIQTMISVGLKDIGIILQLLEIVIN